ncbi:MAG TPA: ATP-dependent DNA helicase RecG [Smithellaceae bacterium]|nr:ATP-dependent DNA helicase RecG [Smithellaceae bacterium]HOQ71166.1 ATP-dependent DNA helicase RecG [Smithellaceae bacterium]HPL09474.1 ATP-dependent DNA helicase RecG [Smithellaceae bacterium]
MESFKKNLQRIEQPLNFAAKDQFKNLPNIRNLGKSLSGLIALQISAIPPAAKNIFGPALDHMMRIFQEYDGKDLQQKKSGIAEASLILERLKYAADNFDARNPGNLQEEQIAARVEDLKISAEKLSAPVQFLKGVGPKMAERFSAKKIQTVEDLLYFLPRTYEDRREIRKIHKLETNRIQTIMAAVADCSFRCYGKRRILEVAVSDNTGVLTAKWFKGRMSHLAGAFQKGTRVIFTGNVTPGYAGKSMIHPDYEILDKEDEENLLNFRRIVPVYSETEGLHQKYIRKVMALALENYSRYIASPIPADICRKRGLINIREALVGAHFPGSDALMEPLQNARSEAHRRLIYDEFFFFQLGMAVKKSGRVLDRGISFAAGGSRLAKFYASLPFELTGAQKRVVDEIHKDLHAPTAMNRLLQGDVGSGKTLVAMSAMVTVCENGYQAALMAPTEILARQHEATLSAWAGPVGLRVVLLTGGMNGAARTEALERIGSGEADIIIGTHALIQENVDFRKLGLVVIDEQHRFGVMQRVALRNKGLSADVLVMTATPIPRTLAMTVYGDLDVSVIDEMPPGKKPVRTLVMGENRREAVYEAIRKELAGNHQAFIVYPLVEQSENLDLKDATKMAEHLQKDIFPNVRVGLIHGKMKDREKDAVMRDFQENQIAILVSTTVIEVGIDVPRASLMVIEHAERFGLSQLHQLRGRVGRRDIPSTCILLADYKASGDARKRLKIMENTTDGFVLAEEDLAIRGPGDFLGTRQSGLPDFRIASIIRDARILNDAKEDAFALIVRDPLLAKPEHAILKETLIAKWQGKLDLARTG